MKLYNWQHECLQTWEANNFRGILHVVTGGGKTFLALNAIDRYLALYPEARIKIVVPTIPLAGQWQTALLHHAVEAEYRPGFFGGGKHDDPDRHVMIYIVNSARKYLPEHVRRDFSLGRHVLLICDECHHYQAPQNRRIFDFMNASYAVKTQYASLGLSATPFGTENDQVLVDTLGPEIYRYDVQNASADGIVSPFTICEVAVTFLPDEKEVYEKLTYELIVLRIKLLRSFPELKELPERAFQSAVSKLAHEAGMDPENAAAAYLLKTWERRRVCILAQSRLLCGSAIVDQLPENERILIFCERITQAEEMCRILRRNKGNVCALYHSEMTKEARQRNMADFRENRARILVSCRCLDEGLDMPDATTGIVLSGASVPRQRIQRLGRIMRKSEGKTAATLYYLYIQESAEDSAFLPGLDSQNNISLRYNSLEQIFSNNLYEYAAMELLDRAREANFDENRLKELRRCLIEGLPRADYLLPENVLEDCSKQSSTRRERNYWQTMKRVGKLFGNKENL